MDYTNIKEKMENTISVFSEKLSEVRAGRANPAVLNKVKIDYYGTPTPINQVAGISVPEARLIVIQPWDISVLKEIEKAILTSDLGLNPSSAGTTIRVPLPPLTEERRRDLIKIVKSEGEQGKVAIRNVRRDANDKIKALLKDKEISENDQHKAEEIIQKVTDNYIKKVDEILADKEKELMDF